MSVSFKGSRGRTARDLVKEVDDFERNQRLADHTGIPQNGVSPSGSAPPGGHAFNVGRSKGMKRKVSISDSINQQNMAIVNNPPSGAPLPFPKDTHALLSTVEGQDEFAKLVAQTTKQKELNKALRTRRKEFEMFLLQTQQEKIREETRKLERKKRRLQQTTLPQLNSATNRQVIERLPSHMNSNMETGS